MLVALVVVGIGLSAVALSFRPDPRRPLALEADRLAVLIEQAREESRLGGMPLAWEWRAEGYTFLRRELSDQGPLWLPITGDDIFRPRDLGAGARIVDVVVDGRPLAEGERVPLHDDGMQSLRLRMALEGARAELVSEPGRDRPRVRVDAAPG